MKNKFNKKWKKFKKSKKKVTLIKNKIKKFKLFKVLDQPLDMVYTKYFESETVRDKDILFESKHGDDLAGNIFNMIYETKRDKYKNHNIYLVLKKELFEPYGKLLSNYGITHVKFIELHTKEYLKALASAKYLVTDTSFPPYFIKKKEQVYLNTWHGTPLKAMGRSVPDREYALGNVQRNFYIADYLLYQNEFSKNIFFDDYMLNEIYRGKVLLSGYPRNSSFYRLDRRDKIRKELELEDKQVMVYMPTWRGLLHKKQNKEQVEKIFGYLAHLDHKLKDNQILYVKLHPFVKKGINYSELLHIKEFPGDYETYDFLNTSDLLITDYSSIMFDYAVSKKKIILFTYDRKEYLGDRGIYIDLDDMDLPKVDTVEELAEEINRESVFYPKFYDRFCSLDSADTAKNVCDTVFLGENTGIKTIDYSSSKESNVLINIKGLKGSEDDHLFIRELNYSKDKNKNYYIHFKSGVMKKFSKNLSLFKKNIGYIPLSPGKNRILSEYLAFAMTFKLRKENSFTKNKIKTLARREKEKNYGNIQFDYVINYSGNDLFLLHVFDAFETAKKIYQFSDFDKVKYNGNKKYKQNIDYALNHLYHYNLVIIQEDMKQLEVVKTLSSKTKVIVAKERFNIDMMLKEVK